jgi:hypothetical protein
MGCDWIDSAGAAVGFKVSFDRVFKGTSFENLDEIRPADHYEDEDAEKENDEDKDAEKEDDEDKDAEKEDDEEEDDEEDDDETEEGEENPHTFLAAKWFEFISKKHAGLVDDKFTVTIGATSMPGAYEKKMYTNSCEVVFGYSMHVTTKNVGDSTELQSPVFSFPHGIKEAIVEFVTTYLHAYKEDAVESSRKKAKTSDLELSDDPKIVYFVY